VTQAEHWLFLLLLSLEESNQRTCEILTHDALSTPRAESFGGVNDEQSHRVLHAHRNFTPSSASALRTPPKISRGAGFGLQRVLVSWSGPRHSENGTHTRTVILSEAKNPDRDGQGCHGLRELSSALTRAVESALNPPAP
jgi:hypothetical protein